MYVLLLGDVLSDSVEEVLVFVMDAQGPLEILAHRVAQDVPLDGVVDSAFDEHHLLLFISDDWLR